MIFYLGCKINRFEGMAQKYFMKGCKPNCRILIVVMAPARMRGRRITLSQASHERSRMGEGCGEATMRQFGLHPYDNK